MVGEGVLESSPCQVQGSNLILDNWGWEEYMKGWEVRGLKKMNKR